MGRGLQLCARMRIGIKSYRQGRIKPIFSRQLKKGKTAILRSRLVLARPIVLDIGDGSRRIQGPKGGGDLVAHAEGLRQTISQTVSAKASIAERT